ncbi:hypothetical protein DFR68_11694 [Nocardia mexicana]|uniref:Outer membrane channel protein CpnT-like N-terminal domain-containing protein n=1 Tax=Nocardia mexicana TaxID=279262 RepID=A0A370GQE1_9NOCA|nr:hypothetical protein DFR68_11694 [Nocardia mexicana]
MIDAPSRRISLRGIGNSPACTYFEGVSLYLPPELRWLGWVAGTEWPDGDEDKLFAAAKAWEEAAAELKKLPDELRAAQEATRSAYPAGQGADAMAALFDELITGDQSIATLAESMRQVSDGTFDTGTHIEAAKLMTIVSLVTLAIEIAWAWLWPPTAPAVEAAAVTATRSWIKLITDRLAGMIARIAETVMSKAAARVFGTYTMRAIEGAAVATGLDLLVQGIQIAKGHRKHIDGTEVGISAVAGGLGGVASRFTANYTGRAFDKFGGAAWNKFAGKEIGDVRGMPFVRGVTVGAAAGLSSTLAGNFVSGAWTGDWAGAFGGPHGYVGGVVRSATVGGIRGGFTARQLSPSSRNPLNPSSYGRTFKGQSSLPGPVRNALGDKDMSPGSDGAARYTRETAEVQSRQARQARDQADYRRDQADRARNHADDLRHQADRARQDGQRARDAADPQRITDSQRHQDGAERRAHEANVVAERKEQQAAQADTRAQAQQERADRAQRVADEQAQHIQDRPQQSAADAQNTANHRQHEANDARTQAARDTETAAQARTAANDRQQDWRELDDRAAARERDAAEARVRADGMDREVTDLDRRTRDLEADDPRRTWMGYQRHEAEQQAAGARQHARELEANAGTARQHAQTARETADTADRNAGTLERRAAQSNEHADSLERNAREAQATADRRHEQVQQLRQQFEQRQTEEQRAQAAIERRAAAAEYERRADVAEQRARVAERAYRDAPPGTPEQQRARAHAEELRGTADRERATADRLAAEQRAEQQARVDAVEEPKRAQELRAQADRMDREAAAAREAGDTDTAQRLTRDADNLRLVADHHDDLGRRARERVDEYGRSPESVLADPTELKAKARPKQYSHPIVMPGPYRAPTAPDAQAWLETGDGSAHKPSDSHS